MKFKPEDIFDQALNGMKNTGSFDNASHSELSEELQIAKLLLTIPKNTIPAASMRRKYALSPANKENIFSAFRIFKITLASVSSFAVIAGIAFAGVQSANALPGQTFFKVKKVAEQARLKLAFNDVEKANLEIKLSEKRLTEAQSILNSNQKDPNLEVAALNELSDQNKATVESVKKATVSSSISKTDHPLVASFNNLAKKQEIFASQIKPEDKIKSLAQNTAKQNIKDSAEISNLISVAGSNNSPINTLKLAGEKDIVSILGQASKVGKDYITVERVSFAITEETTILDQNGNALSLDQVKENSRVNVIGKKTAPQNGFLKANTILVITAEISGEVKGNATQTTPNLLPKTSTQSSESVTNNPNEATGSFIVEDPRSSQ